MTWQDLRAFVLHLPPTSAFRRHINPQAARVLEWMAPTSQLLAALYDQQWELAFWRNEKEVPEPFRNVLGRLSENDIKRFSDATEQEEKPAKPTAAKRRKLTPSQIRAKVAAQTKRAS